MSDDNQLTLIRQHPCHQPPTWKDGPAPQILPPRLIFTSPHLLTKAGTLLICAALPDSQQSIYAALHSLIYATALLKYVRHMKKTTSQQQKIKLL
jgi:hypothetical protein